jgi:DNA-binding NarL/FixJ family response regulator
VNRRVVLLDNDPAVLDLLMLDLQLEGHDVLAAVTTAHAAIDACRDLEPDAAVVDLRLGAGPDGVEVAAKIRATGRQVVVYTNYVTPDVVARAREVGAIVVEKGNLGALRRAVAG